MAPPLKPTALPLHRGGSEIWRSLLGLQEVAMLIPVVVLTLGFYGVNPNMLSAVTVRSVLYTVAYPGLVAMGLVLLMIVGEIDFSTGPVMGLCAVVAAWLMNMHGWPSWAGAVGGLLLALAVGLVNGVLTVKLGAPSLVVTLAVGVTARGAGYMLTTQGGPIYPLPPEVGALGTLRPLGLSVAIILMLVMLAAMHTLLSRTRWGAAAYATGGNKIAAQRCGINTDRVKIIAFMLTSLLAGVAGMLIMCQLTTGDPIIGRTQELSILTGVVLGGTSFWGGRGSAINAFLGILLVQIVKTGLILIHVGAAWHILIIGVLFVLAAAIDAKRRRQT
jgi:ribose transport system permease protein